MLAEVNKRCPRCFLLHLRSGCMSATPVIAHKPFILSRATATTIRAAMGRGRSGQVRAPVDFRRHVTDFKYIDECAYAFDTSPSFAIPAAILDTTLKRNIAYYARPPVGAEEKSIQFEELSYKAKDGEVFQLKEPEQEREIIGPILEMSGTKMHLSKDYKTTLDFSRKLARAADVRRGQRVLDMFLGLGYCAGELRRLGAAQVHCFEKYPEVVQLLHRNPFSPPLDTIVHHVQDVTKTSAFFAQLEALATPAFDACVIDPAKKNVMLHVYSTQFLSRLAKSLKKGANVVAYVPEPGISPRFQAMHLNLHNTFEKSGYSFSGYAENDKFVFMFKKS